MDPSTPPQRRSELLACGRSPRAVGRTGAACPEPCVTVGGAFVDHLWPPEEHSSGDVGVLCHLLSACVSFLESPLILTASFKQFTSRAPPPRRSARERSEPEPARVLHARLAALWLLALCLVWEVGIPSAPWRSCPRHGSVAPGPP